MDSSCPACDAIPAIVGFREVKHPEGAPEKLAKLGPPTIYEAMPPESATNFAEHFMAMSETEDSEGHTTYPIFFVNNTADQIDEIEMIGSHYWAWMESIATEEASRFLHGSACMPPYSFVRADTYQNWDFDWSNDHCFMFRSGEKVRRLFFDVPKFSVANRKIDLPFLNKRGWVIN